MTLLLRPVQSMEEVTTAVACGDGAAAGVTAKRRRIVVTDLASAVAALQRAVDA